MQTDISQIKKVFIIGIGGVGISAVARMLLEKSVEVYGSDISSSAYTEDLKKNGAHIIIGQDFEFIPNDADLVIYSIAIMHYDKELFAKLKNSNFNISSYPEMLKEISKDKFTIAISGTHGKTTTTAMIAKMLIDAGFDPTVIVGSILKETNTNYISGKSKYLVVEACEYERSFLNLHPNIIVITNIETDHLDYYKDLSDIQNAFRDFIDQIDLFGNVICNKTHMSLLPVLKNQKVEITDYTQYIDSLPALSYPGEHNRQNGASAKAVGVILGIPEEKINESLKSFSGTARRLEKKGVTKDGTIVYDDYAHHPTEVRASLQALREMFPTKKLNIVFQPHLYSRTKALFDDFVTAFDDADRVGFLPIYFAREDPDPSVSSEKLSDEISRHKIGVTSIVNFADAPEYLRSLNLGANDVLVTMGAGEAYKVGENLLVR
jgi:UDP-N-acetylmuramate--alanine ligase